MKPYFIFFVFTLILIGCSKKKPSLDEIIKESQPGQPKVSVNLPLLPGRNIELLKTKPYGDRILAYSIELGKRSADFDKRLDGILTLAAARSDWKDVIHLVTATENFQMAAQFNKMHLDSLLGIIHNPPDVFKASYEELLQAHRGLFRNYDTLDSCGQYEKLPDMVESIIRNELLINQALKNFEKVIRAERQKKLPG